MQSSVEARLPASGGRCGQDRCGCSTPIPVTAVRPSPWCAMSSEHSPTLCVAAGSPNEMFASIDPTGAKPWAPARIPPTRERTARRSRCASQRAIRARSTCPPTRPPHLDEHAKRQPTDNADDLLPLDVTMRRPETSSGTPRIDQPDPEVAQTGRRRPSTSLRTPHRSSPRPSRSPRLRHRRAHPRHGHPVAIWVVPERRPERPQPAGIHADLDARRHPRDCQPALTNGRAGRPTQRLVRSVAQ